MDSDILTSGFTLLSFQVWLAAIGCVVVGIMIMCCFEVGNTHIKAELLTESYLESLSTVSIVVFATALLKGN